MNTGFTNEQIIQMIKEQEAGENAERMAGALQHPRAHSAFQTLPPIEFAEKTDMDKLAT